MVKLSPAYLKKLEDSLKEMGYEVRYEKGNFKSGYCLVESRKVVMVNKFSVLESRIQSLSEILLHLRSQPAEGLFAPETEPEESSPSLSEN